MSPDSAGVRTYNTYSSFQPLLKAGQALLFEADGAAGYKAAVKWTDAVKYVKFVQNPQAPPRPVITFPAANTGVSRAELKLDWTMSGQPGHI
jgi:hypothetical protein